MGLKITEIKVTAGKDVLILNPESVQAVISGKSVFLDAKLSATLFKAVAGPCEKVMGEMKTYKSP
jgi:hypothetical protein